MPYTCLTFLTSCVKCTLPVQSIEAANLNRPLTVVAGRLTDETELLFICDHFFFFHHHLTNCRIKVTEKVKYVPQLTRLLKL